MTDDIDRLRAEALASNKCFTKGRLKDELRMRPKDDAMPVKTYKGRFGDRYGVYLVADCVPLRKLTSKAGFSAKQLASHKSLAMRAKLKSRMARAGSVAQKLLSDKPYFLDTETTGLGCDAQIIELAVCDALGNSVFNSRIRPTVDIEPEAMAVHGISMDDLLTAPGWLEVSDQIREILQDRLVIAFNASFDLRLMRQTAEAAGDNRDWIDVLQVSCAMALSVDAFGATNRHGTISLASSLSAIGVCHRGAAHQAMTDALAVRDLVVSLAEHYEEIKTTISCAHEKTPTLKE